MKLDRIISLATLATAMVAIVLVLKRPAPVAQPQAPAATATRAESSDRGSSDHASSNPATAQPQPAAQAMQPSGAYQSAKPVAGQVSAQPATQVAAAPNATADSQAGQIGSLVAKMLGNSGGGALTPDSNVGSGEPNIKDQQVTTEGDLVHGRFLTEIGGKDVWVTISGHMGEKDGYATFDPTEFKVGDTEVPVALVNPMLQRKLAEERDRMKVPNSPQ
jgi:hypothetical protein